MHILVTGAAGFVGRHVLHALRDKGHQVTALYRSKPEDTDPSITIKTLTFSPDTDWDSLLQHSAFDAIIHLADGLRPFEGLKQSPGKAVEQAALETSFVLAKAAIKANIKTFVYLSSIKAASGAASDHVLVETDPPAPSRPLYGQLKGQIEKQLDAMAEHSPMDVISLRSPIVYGPGGKNNFWKMIRLADSPLPLPLAALKNKRSIIALSNLADGLICAAENKPGLSGAYFIHDGAPLSVPELITLLRRHLGRPARLFPVPVQLFQLAEHVPALKPIITRLSKPLSLSDQKFRQHFHWHPPTSTHNALKQTIKAYHSS